MRPPKFWTAPLSRPEDVASESPENCCRLTPRLQRPPTNIRIYKPYIASNCSPCATSLPLIVWVYLHSILVLGCENACILKQCEMAVQGHPRSLILVPIESAYATFHWSSIVTLVLSCLVSQILQVFWWEQQPHPFPPEFWGCSPWTSLPLLGVRGAKTLT